MKKTWIALLAILTVCVLVLAGCGGAESTPSTEEALPEEPAEVEVEEAEEETESEEAEEVLPEESALKDRLDEITDDFDSTVSKLEDALDQVYLDLGDTYEEYSANKQLLFDWFDTVEEELDALFDRTYDNSIAYFQAVAETVDHDDWDALNDAVNDFYDTVVAQALNNVYDSIISDALYGIYDRYYGDEGIMNQALESGSFTEWSNLFDEFYTVWDGSWTVLYDLWSDTWDDLYNTYYSVLNAFLWEDNFDMDDILAQMEEEESEPEAEAEAEEEDSENLVDGMRAEFKSAMDSYEKFFDSFCEFLKKFADFDGTDMSMMTEYLDFMEQYAEVEASLESWDEDEMNDTELMYYLDVITRIAEKVSDVADLF